MPRPINATDEARADVLTTYRRKRRHQRPIAAARDEVDAWARFLADKLAAGTLTAHSRRYGTERYAAAVEMLETVYRHAGISDDGEITPRRRFWLYGRRAAA
jgi:hypothetical protein